MRPKRLSLRNPRILEALLSVEGPGALTSTVVLVQEYERKEVERRCANTEQHHPKAMAGCGFSARVRRQISENERPAADADEQPKPEGRESIERGKCRVSEKVRHVACSTLSPDQLAGSMPATWHRKRPQYRAHPGGTAGVCSQGGLA